LRQGNYALVMSEESIIIIGAGPSGLALSASLKAKNIRFRLLDRKGRVGGAYSAMYEEMQLASPAKYVSLPGRPLLHHREYIKAGEYADYLRRYAEYFSLVPEMANIMNISALGQSLGYRIATVATQDAKNRNSGTNDIIARHVVLATGMYDSPRYSPAVAQVLNQGAGVQIVHAHAWRGVSEWLGKSVLIQGSATSAVEIAESFAEAGQAVSVSSREKRFNSIPQRLLGRDIHDLLVPLAKLPTWMLRQHCRRYYGNEGKPLTEPATHRALTNYVNNGMIKIKSDIKSIEGRRVYFYDDQPGEFDVIICATGYSFNYDFVNHGESSAQFTKGFEKGASRRWPGLYLMGKSCLFGRPSQFIWGIAHDAPLLSDVIATKLKKNAAASV